MKKKLEAYCCEKCKHFTQFYIAKEIGYIHTIGYGYCYKIKTTISKQKQCDRFEESEQSFNHKENFQCFTELALLKSKFKELKQFLNDHDFN